MIATPETLTSAVVAQLEKIRVENGYKSDVGRVYRVRLIEDQIPEGTLPALVVVTAPNGHTFTPMGNGSYEAKLRLVVGGMVSQGTADLYDSERATLLNYLFEDTIDALLEDPSFGFKPNADSVLESGDDDVDTDRGFGLFALTLHLTYCFARGTL